MTVAAEKMKISRQWLLQLIKDGEIPAKQTVQGHMVHERHAVPWVKRSPGRPKSAAKNGESE